MKQPTYAEYVSVIMNLIYFEDKARWVLPECEIKKINELIEILRFWAQFENPRFQTKKREK